MTVRVRRRGRLAKALIDRFGAVILILLTLPVMLAVAAAITLHDGGPPLYRQVRVGLDGARFRMWKFRTMRVDADRDFPPGNDGHGPLFKLHDDPRVTPVGRVLRRWSLDELPQLANVAAGSMSLVGPRPPLPEEAARYGHSTSRRLLVKPGMTGLWQVHGRSDLSWEESVRLDLRYVDDWSLAMDAVILGKTVRAVVGGKGAY